MGIRKLNAMKTMAALGALAFAAWSVPAGAVEIVTPYLPGNSVGTPTGASPPPGVYGVNSIDLLTGPLVDNNGNNIPGGKVSVAIEIPVIVWVPNFKVFGATYNVAVIQPYVQQTVDVGSGAVGPGGPDLAFVQNGLFNTIIVPGNLSWMVAPGLFASVGLGIYIPDGTYSDSAVFSSGHVVGRAVNGSSIANNYWTFEPDVAVSYLGGGWNITGKITFDINTENDSTHYQSGDAFFFDWTIAHKFGKWEAGIGGLVVQQLNNDTGFGAPSNGHQYSLIALGPIVSYDFGPVTLESKFLPAVSAANGGKISQLYLTAIWGF